MRSLIVTIFVTFSSISAFAGGAGSGGGDPRAAETVAIAKNLCVWFSNYETYKKYSTSCTSEVNDLEDSLNNSNRSARIHFEKDVITDSNGIPKDLITHPDRTIVGNIDRWDKDSHLQKSDAVIMELCLLLKIPNRYSVAQNYLNWTQTGTVNKRPVNIVGAEFEEKTFIGITGNPYKANIVLNLANDEILYLRCRDKDRPFALDWSVEIKKDFDYKELYKGAKFYNDDLGCKNELKNVYYNIARELRWFQESGGEQFTGKIPVNFAISPDNNLNVIYETGADKAPDDIREYYFRFESPLPHRAKIGKGNGVPTIRICSASDTRSEASYYKNQRDDRELRVNLTGSPTRSHSFWDSDVYSIVCDNHSTDLYIDEKGNLNGKRFTIGPKDMCDEAVNYILMKTKSGECVNLVLFDSIPEAPVEEIY